VSVPDREVPTDGHRASGDAAPSVGELLGPLPVWAVTAMLGSLTAEHAYLAGELRPLALVTVGAGAVTLILLARATSMRPTHPRSLLALLAVLLVGAAGTQLRIDTLTRGLLPPLAAQGGVAELLVTVAAEPRPIATGWHVVVRVDAVAGTATRERAALTLAEDPPALGSRWAVRATARPRSTDGYGRWLERQHVAVVLDVRTWEPVAGSGRLAAASEEVRARVRTAATRHLDAGRGGLLVGFVTGDTRLLPPADGDAMRDSGLSHLTAVSGSNLALVVAGVVALGRGLRLGAAGRRWLIGGAVLWFAFVTRFEPSVLRAGTMAGVVLLAGARGVARDTRHALAGAVLLLVLIDPRLAGSLGLVLSATATAGVLVLAPMVRSRLPAATPRWLAGIASITLGAQIAVLPVVLTAFQETSLGSIPANLVAVPVAGLAAILAFVGTALALVHPGAAAMVFALAGPAAGVVLATAHRFDGIGARVGTARPVTVVALVAGCGWVLSRRRSAASHRFGFAVVVLTLLASLPALVGRLPPVGFTLTAIDVGQGDAFLVETPGARLLFDAGGDGRAAAWLRANGRTRIDLLVVSHPHLDHAGGAPEVLRRVRVGEVWLNRDVPSELSETRETLQVAHDRAVPVRSPRVGDAVTFGDVSVTVLHPAAGRPYRFGDSEANDSSYVLSIQYGDRRVLLAGDVEGTAQADLLARDPERLRAELMTVPHHGSRTSDPPFLARVAPLIGVISAGRDNRHGHPHDDIVAFLQGHGTVIRRTDLEGTVRVEVPHRVGAGEDRQSGSARRKPDRTETGRSAIRSGRGWAGLGSDDDLRDPALRLRRPPVAAGARAPSRRTPRPRSRADRRRSGRLGDRSPTRTADHVALRRHDLRGPPRGRAPRGRAQGRGRELPGSSVRGRRPRAGGARGGPHPEDREAGEGAGRTARREDAARLGRPGVGSPRG
jgi:competence protein ComEC